MSQGKSSGFMPYHGWFSSTATSVGGVTRILGTSAANGDRPARGCVHRVSCVASSSMATRWAISVMCTSASSMVSEVRKRRVTTALAVRLRGAGSPKLVSTARTRVASSVKAFIAAWVICQGAASGIIDRTTSGICMVALCNSAANTSSIMGCHSAYHRLSRSMRAGTMRPD